MNYFMTTFQKYTEFSGRSSRKEYWMWVLWIIGIRIVLSILSAALSLTDPRTGSSILSTMFDLVIFLPTLALAVRRMHDQDQSGWLLLIPIYGLIAVWFIPGTKGKNKYGVAPKY